MHLETESNVYGLTVNPFNRGLTPGGSSGGEAALIGMRGSILVSIHLLEIKYLLSNMRRGLVATLAAASDVQQLTLVSMASSKL